MKRILTMIFQDRQQAGEELAKALGQYQGRPDVIVVALPRGGVVVGKVVADALGGPLDIVVPRKIGFPGQEEYAIGAITETGEVVWNEEEKRRVSGEYVAEVMQREQVEAKRRLEVYRAGRPRRDLKNKIVIVIDDGVATGYTMRAALKTVRAEGAKKIIVAVPLAPPDTVEMLQKEVDEVVALQQPTFFWAIGAHYQEFHQVSDEEVVQLMKENADVHAG